MRRSPPKAHGRDSLRLTLRLSAAAGLGVAPRVPPGRAHGRRRAGRGPRLPPDGGRRLTPRLAEGRAGRRAAIRWPSSWPRRCPRPCPEVLARLKNLFDLDARPETHRRTSAVATRGSARRSIGLPGLRVPGAFDGFELAVRAILGQRISVERRRRSPAGSRARFGEPIETPFPGLDRLSPPPDRLAEADEQDLTALGIAAPRAAAIRAIARAVAERRARPPARPDPERAIAALQQFPGLGDWTAQYIAMRALRWPDAFPAGDLGLLKASGVASPAGSATRPRPGAPGGPMRPCISGRPVVPRYPHHGDLQSDRLARGSATISSPVGELVLTSDGEALTGLHLPRPDGGAAPRPGRNGGATRPRSARSSTSCNAYFAGERSDFDLPHRAWPGRRSSGSPGTPCSRSRSARRSATPSRHGGSAARGPRAVGAANGRNPIAIVVPCHRVIGSNGSLTGYGGGLPLKEWLLDHESCVQDSRARSSSDPESCKPSLRG